MYPFYCNGRLLSLLATTAFASISFLDAATINYTDRSSSSYEFTNIREVSALNTFLGGDPLNPSSTPAVVGNTLTFAPNTFLQVATANSASNTGNSTQHSSTAFGFDIKGKGLNSIDKLKIDITGTYNLFSVNLGSGTSMSVVSITIPMTLQIFAANQAPYPTVPSLGFNLVVTPSSVTASANGVGNVSAPSGIWTGSWSGATVGDTFTEDLNKIFSIPSMKITELSVMITPDLTAFRTISDQNSASIFMTNASFAVIPEPSSSALLAFGLASIAFVRRRAR